VFADAISGNTNKAIIRRLVQRKVRRVCMGIPP
jgi:hypothetical protein